jgi:hypothetical protein
MRKQAFPLFALSLLAACSSRPIDSDCDGMCQPAGPNYPGVGECKEGVCTPTYADCSIKSEISTCAEACEAQGSLCVANGCGGYTYQLYTVLEWCEPPDAMGAQIKRGCDEPIDWQVNSAVRCCCEQ